MRKNQQRGRSNIFLALTKLSLPDNEKRQSLDFPLGKKKENPTNIFIFLHCFLDLITAEISLTMWTATVLSSRLHRQAVITTVPAHNFPRLQAGNEQRTTENSQSSKKNPLLLLREDRRVWHQSYRPEKITLNKERRDGKDAAARNSYRASKRLKISERPSDVLGKAKTFLLLQLPTRKGRAK